MELEDFRRGASARTAQGQWALPAGMPDLQGLPEAKLAPLASGTQSLFSWFPRMSVCTLAAPHADAFHSTRTAVGVPDLQGLPGGQVGGPGCMQACLMLLQEAAWLLIFGSSQPLRTTHQQAFLSRSLRF